MNIRAYKADDLSDFNTMTGRMLAWIENSNKFIQSACDDYSTDKFYCDSTGTYLIPIPDHFRSIIESELNAEELAKVNTFDSNVSADACNFPFIVQEEVEDNDKVYDSYGRESNGGSQNWGKKPAGETIILDTSYNPTSGSLPIANYYKYAITGSIYSKESLGGKAMRIKEIQYNSGSQEYGGQVYRKLTYYMAHTDQYSFKDMYDTITTANWKSFMDAFEATGDLSTSTVKLPGMNYKHMKRVLGDNNNSTDAFEMYFQPINRDTWYSKEDDNNYQQWYQNKTKY